MLLGLGFKQKFEIPSRQPFIRRGVGKERVGCGRPVRGRRAQMRQMAVGSDPDSFDMSALKAALGGRGGGCQPPTHAAKEHAAREQSECAERDVGDDAAGAEACASSPVGSGDGGKDGPGGGGATRRVRLREQRRRGGWRCHRTRRKTWTRLTPHTRLHAAVGTAPAQLGRPRSP
jgi:hypothetical protein